MALDKECGEPSTVPGESAYKCCLPAGHGGGFHKCIDGKVWNKTYTPPPTYLDGMNDGYGIGQSTLRDQFAMAAPIPMCGRTAGELPQTGKYWEKALVINCRARYMWADAMLEARKVKP